MLPLPQKPPELCSFREKKAQFSSVKTHDTIFNEILWQPQDICSHVAATDKCTMQHQANISIKFANKRKSSYHPWCLEIWIQEQADEFLP